jgi:hypothetical protein
VPARDMQEYCYNRYQKLKSGGLCVRCQKPRDCPSVCLCSACLDAARERERGVRGGLKWKPGSPGRAPLEVRHARKAG